MKPCLIVHGGAWTIPPDATEACRAGCRAALEAGWRVFAQGGAALDAVEAAIVVLEDDPVFDAGTGAHLNLAGRVELDAIVMDGATLEAGSVAALQHIRNPIRLARRVLESSEHMMLVGEGAEQFAAEQGISLCDATELVVPRERAAWERCHTQDHADSHHVHRDHVHQGHVHQGGTVGAVAVDANGRVVAGTSTGGTCCKHPGRVGDSPLIGCGCYADGEAGGVSCTGWGEAIMKIVMAKTAVDVLRRENPQRAAQSCVDLLASRTGGTGGLILLDREGTPAAAFNTPNMAWGCVQPDGSFFVSA